MTYLLAVLHEGARRMPDERSIHQRGGAQLLTRLDVARRARVSQSTVSLVLNGETAGQVS